MEQYVFFKVSEYILGDLMDEENVLEFLTSLEAMDLPDRIEEVNSKILGKIVEETDFVAVLFCKFFTLLPLFFFTVFSDIDKNFLLEVKKIVFFPFLYIGSI